MYEILKIEANVRSNIPCAFYRKDRVMGWISGHPPVYQSQGLCLNKGIANWNRDIPQSSVLITDLANIVSCFHISCTEAPAQFFPHTSSFLLKASLWIHVKSEDHFSLKQQFLWVDHKGKALLKVHLPIYLEEWKTTIRILLNRKQIQDLDVKVRW